MSIISRSITKNFESKLFKGKVVILYGPRQAGKTTFVKNVCQKYPGYKYINCDVPENAEKLTPRAAQKIKDFFGNSNLVILDEAQRIKDIGLTLKILVDTYPEIQIVATGSSSFDLEDKLAEPLTGRHYDFMLLPFSYRELVETENNNLEFRLLYGSYPEVIFPKIGDGPEQRIKSIAEDYALKDVLAFEGIRKSETLKKLLKLLAYQMAGEVSFREISANFNMSVQTVQNYVEILQKAFIIFLVDPIAKNPRMALRRTKKVYFYDNGLRNALINNFDSLDVRTDKGALFENYIMAEFYKKNFFTGQEKNIYYFRSYTGEEIDIITQEGETLEGYECKFFSESSLIKKSATAPVSCVQIISKENYGKFLC